MIELLGRTRGYGLVVGEVCHWGQALRFQKLTSFPVTSLSLEAVSQDVSSELRLLHHHACLSVAMLLDIRVLDSLPKIVRTLILVALAMVLCHNN